MLAVLDVFRSDNPVCSAEEIAASLGYSLGTTYRYIRELVATGLVTRTETGFCLGPRIIELDLAIRQCALRSSPPASRSCGVCATVSGCDVLLIQFFNDRVVVSHHFKGDNQITVSFGRGKVMPLFRGAGSKALLAALPRARQKRLYDTFAAQITADGMGADWTAFRRNLVQFQIDRHAISIEELDKGNVGVAAAIPGTQHGLVLVFSTRRYAVLDKSLVRDEVIAGADAIGWMLSGGPAVQDEGRQEPIREIERAKG